MSLSRCWKKEDVPIRFSMKSNPGFDPEAASAVSLNPAMIIRRLQSSFLLVISGLDLASRVTHSLGSDRIVAGAPR